MNIQSNKKKLFFLKSKIPKKYFAKHTYGNLLVLPFTMVH